MTGPGADDAGETPASTSAPAAVAHNHRRWGTLAVAVCSDLALASLLLWPRLARSAGISCAIIGGLIVVVAMQWAGFLRARRQGRLPTVEVRIVRAHVVPVLSQSVVLLYWAYYWPNVSDHFPHFAAQVSFAYAYDIGLAWCMGRAWRLGFSPIPVAISLNFFLWFGDDYFALQLAMIAVAFVGKALLTWERGGIRRHIFNPSALPLFIVACVLLVTRERSLTNVNDFPLAFEVPLHMYEVVFLLSLFVNLWVDTVLITLCACLVMTLTYMLPLDVMGDAFMRSRPFGAQVLLGTVLLVTDPSTSPSTRIGKAIFGALYGLLAVAALAGLRATDSTAAWDKILPVFFLNLLVRRIDGWAVAIGARARRLPAALRAIAGSRHVHLGAWCALFLLALPRLHHPAYQRTTKRPSAASMLSPDVGMRLRARARLCEEQPRLCAPFAFGAELRWWLDGPDWPGAYPSTFDRMSPDPTVNRSSP